MIGVNVKIHIDWDDFLKISNQQQSKKIRQNHLLL